VNQEWTFLCNFDITADMLHRAEAQSLVQAKLIDYLSHTEKGLETQAPEQVPDVIPWRRRKIQVASPNVFTPTRWVRRNLTQKELMDIYDVSVSLRPSKDEKREETTDFTQQIPARVLLQCLDAVMSASLSPTKNVKPMAVVEANDAGGGRGDDILHEIKYLEDMVVDEVFANSKRSGLEEVVDDKLARKNDDAEVEVEEWNVRVAECAGFSYIAKKHGPAMDVLRRCLFRRYCHHRYGLIIPRMFKDIEFLRAMFVDAQPARRLVRGSRIARIVYGFGDASGAGFGSSWMEVGQVEDTTNEVKSNTTKVKYRFGRWGSEGVGTSSNYRELRNLVESLEEMGRQQELTGVEVFLFTDNSTAEAAFNRGSSSSSTLFDLVKKVKLLEMCHQARVHVIHVAGTRMIVQGTDGLSRGCLVEGVMKGDSIASFIPLHETALQRSGDIMPWLKEAHGGSAGKELTVLSKEDWFWKGHDIVGGTTNVDGRWLPRYGVGQYVWAPPPCVAAQCLDEIRKARHKRQLSTHVFVCPRIMTVEWQRQLYKSADLVLVINPGHQIWEENQHEPLILGFYFPYLRHEPWQLKGSQKLVAMGGYLQRVCKEDPGSSGRLLRQLWEFTQKLPHMSEQLVCKLLRRSESHHLSQATPRKRRRPSVAEKER
jgi:hypothetical protein